MAYRKMVLVGVLWGALAGVAGAQTPAQRAALDSAFADLIRTNFYTASQKYEAILAADSTVAEAYRYLGWMRIFTEKEDIQRVADALQRAVALNPNDAGARNDLGYIHAFQVNYPLAVKEFEAAARLGPDRPLFHRNLGFAAAESRDYAAAEKAFRKALELEPMDDLSLYGLGRALARQEKTDEALVYYRKGINVKPGLKEAHMGIGEILNRRGELEQAAAAYERAMQVDFYDSKPHYALATIYQRMGDSTRAKQERAKYLLLEKEYRYQVRDHYILPVTVDRVVAFRERGEVYSRLGRHEEALALYRKGLALADSAGSPYRFSPDLPVLWLSIGRSYQLMGEVEKARQAYRAALAGADEAPPGEVARVVLSDLFLCAGGLPDAEVKNYERAVAMDPSSSAAFWVYDRISQVQKQARTLERCIAAYEARRDSVPNSVGLRLRLGVAYAAAGRLDAATAEYREAMNGVEHTGELYRQLAELYRRAGRGAAADSLMSRAGASGASGGVGAAFPGGF